MSTVRPFNGTAVGFLQVLEKRALHLSEGKARLPRVRMLGLSFTLTWESLFTLRKVGLSVTSERVFWSHCLLEAPSLALLSTDLICSEWRLHEIRPSRSPVCVGAGTSEGVSSQPRRFGRKLKLHARNSSLLENLCLVLHTGMDQPGAHGHPMACPCQ